MNPLAWSDADEIGRRLAEEHSGADPLAVRFTDLRRMVLALDGFDDDPAGGGEAALEAIQMAWLEWVRDR